MHINSKPLLSLNQKCGWITQNEKMMLKPTEKGQSLLKINDPITRLREQIKDIIIGYPPTWLGIINRGRKEVKRNMSNNEIQCFEAAYLFREDDISVVQWWDTLIVSSFDRIDLENHQIGRIGELLSLILEEIRIGQKPYLVSLDVNFAGYDIESQVGKNDKTKLFIEVKTSIREWSHATFFLTRHEWDVLSQNKNAVVHLWTIQPELKFAFVHFDAIENSIPIDSGSGKWKKVEIPFSLTHSIENPSDIVNLKKNQIKQLMKSYKKKDINSQDNNNQNPW